MPGPIAARMRLGLGAKILHGLDDPDDDARGETSPPHMGSSDYACRVVTEEHWEVNRHQHRQGEIRLVVTRASTCGRRPISHGPSTTAMSAPCTWCMKTSRRAGRPIAAATRRWFSATASGVVANSATEVEGVVWANADALRSGR